MIFAVKTEVFAQNIYYPRSVKVIKFSPEKGEVKNFYPLLGEIIEIDGEINGDIYAIGNEIIVDGVVNGDVITASEKLTVNGEINGNLRAIAENIVISGKVENNVTVIGAFVELLPESVIKGGLITISQISIISAPVDGQVKLLGESITLNNSVGSDTEIWAKDINIASEAKLTDLTYFSENSAIIDPEASISGKLLKSENTFFGQGLDISGFRNSVYKFAGKSRIFFGFIAFLWAFLIGILYIRLFPKTLLKTTHNLDKYFIKSALIGFVSLIVVPILIFISMITVVGIPLGLFIFFVFLTFIYFAKITFSFWIGKKVMKNDNQFYLAMGLGLIIYYLLINLRIFGGIVSFIALIFGLGSQLITIYEQHKNLSGKKLL
jgi:cytoskeletal protein CcmA (bactofilin family)